LRCTRCGRTARSRTCKADPEFFSSRFARHSCCSCFRVAATDAALKVAVPQQNLVGVVIDDSRSMKVADQDGKPRGDYVKDQGRAH
jgi:hypothetical protein